MTYQLHADHHIAIGRTHSSDGRPCQDHALSGIVKKYGDVAFAYAVIADGCSSAGETDIGARLLTTLTAKAIRDEYATGDDRIDIDSEAYEVANTLGLKASDLYATHLYAVVDTEGNGFVMVKGDGVVAFKTDFGALSVHRFEWADNMPYYPLYSQEGLQSFYIHHGGRLGPALTVTSILIEPNGEVTNCDSIIHTVEAGAAGFTLPIKDAGLSMICLFSDGISQIDKVDWIDAVKEATAFKNIAGTFVKRRMIRFIKDLMKQGRGPQDDISLAVISLSKPDLDGDPARTAFHDIEKPAEQPADTLNVSGQP